MRVRVPFYRFLPTCLIIIFLGAAIVFGFTFDLFLFKHPYDWRQYTIIGIWLVLSTGLLLLTGLTSYYDVYKKYVSVQKGFKKLVYYYSDVVYIDEEKSEKKKTVMFYTRQGHTRYLMFDKQGILYQTMITHCKNRMSKEEFERNYPQVKF